MKNPVKWFMLTFAFTFIPSTAGLGQTAPDPITENQRDEIRGLFEEAYSKIVQYKDEHLTLVNFPPNGLEDVEGTGDQVAEFQKKLNQIVALIYEKPYQVYPDHQVITEIRHSVYKNLPIDSRQTIENMVFLKASDKRIFRLISVFPDGFAEVVDGYIKRGQLSADLASLPVGSQQSRVEWDSHFSQYRFTDQALLEKVARISMVASYQKQIFMQEVQKLDQTYLEALRTNTQTADGASKFETFDLIQGLAANELELVYAMNIRSFDRIMASKISHRALYDLFQSTPTEDSRGAAIPYLHGVRQKLGSNIDLFCAGPMTFEGHNPNAFGGMVSRFNINISDFSRYSEFGCGPYTYRPEVVKESEIQYPQPMDFDLEQFRSGKPVQVTVNLSLIEEASGPMVHVAKYFLRYKGFKLKEQKTVDTLSSIRKDFTNSHIFIPASHSLDINQFNFGTRQSIRFDLEKTVETDSGAKVPVHVKLYLPMKESDRLIESGTIVADWLSERRQKLPYPLFVMNASCDSASNNVAWNSVYHMSIIADMEAGRVDIDRLPLDFIHSVGSNVGFDTAGPSSILQNFYYPIQLIESLASGQTVQSTLTDLKEPVPYDPILALVRTLERGRSAWDNLIERIRRVKPENKLPKRGGNDLPDYDRGFGPVFNLDEPDALVAGEEYVNLHDLADPDRVLRF